MNQITHPMMADARAALLLKEEIEQLTTELETYKDNFRKFADGEKLPFEVPKMGKILVKAPLPEKQVTKAVISEEALNAQPELKERLLKTGVLKYETKTQAARKAAVEFTLNI